MDEIFFFMYHMHQTKEQVMSLPIVERRYIIDKFVQQKNLEKEEIDKAKRQANKRR